jgi:hypothetical protein
MARTRDPATGAPRHLLEPVPLALIGLAALGLAALATVQAGVTLAHQGQPIPWVGLLKARLVESLLYALYLPGLCWLAWRRPIDAAWRWTLPLYLFVGAAVALSKEALYVAIGNWFRPGVFHLPTILAEDFSSELLTVAALVAVAHAISFRDRANRQKEELPRRTDGAAGEPVFAARGPGGHHLLHARDLIRIDAQGNYSRLASAQGRFLVRETIAAIEQRLPPRFLRVHRSHIVDMDRVIRLEPLSHGRYAIHLESGEPIISSRSFARAIRARLAGGSSPIRPR